MFGCDTTGGKTSPITFRAIGRTASSVAGDYQILKASSFLRRGQGSRGQSMVEFALMAPLLFLILFGIVDFGRAIFYSNEITNAAREGARVAILASNPCNTQVANPSPGNCTTSSGTGPTVCQAMKDEANLIPSANWNNCVDGTNQMAAVPPCITAGGCTANADNAYVEVDSLASCATAATQPSRDTTSGRPAGNKAIRVTIAYYFRPLTGLVGVFFPSNFRLTSTTCARQEW